MLSTDSSCFEGFLVSLRVFQSCASSFFVFKCCFDVQLLHIVHVKRKIEVYFVVVSLCNPSILYTVTQIECLSYTCRYLSVVCLDSKSACIKICLPSISWSLKRNRKEKCEK